MNDVDESPAVLAGRSIPGARLAGRAGWAVIDQGLISFANFSLGVIVARLVSPSEFGAFGVAFALYLVALNIARGLATQPLTIRFVGREPEAFHRGAASATGVAFTLGVLGAVVCVAVAAFEGGVLGAALLGLAISLPGLMVQDAWRFVLFTRREGRTAVINDVIAMASMAMLIAGTVATAQVSVLTIMVCWGGGATAAAIVGIAQTAIRPDLRHTMRWLREHWDITPRFLVSELIQMAGSQLVVFALGAFVGLTAVASVRGAQLLLGPAYVLAVGVHLSMVPEAARLVSSIVHFRRLTLLASVGLGLAGGVYALVLLLVPDSIGVELLGESWPGARDVLLPIAIASLIPLVTAGPQIGLRALEDAMRTLRASAVQSVLAIIGGVGGAILGGTVLAAWGLAIGLTVAGLVWWFELLVATRRHAARLAPSIEPPARPA